MSLASTSMELCSGSTRKPFASSCASWLAGCARLRSDVVDAVEGQGGKPIAELTRKPRQSPAFEHTQLRQLGSEMSIIDLQIYIIDIYVCIYMIYIYVHVYMRQQRLAPQEIDGKEA